MAASILTKAFWPILGGLVAGSGFCGYKWQTSKPAPGALEAKVLYTPTVMPIAYKAYGNPQAAGGRYYLAKTILHNSGGLPIKNVRVSYRVPGYVDNWTTAEPYDQVLPGQTLVDLYYPKFNRDISKTRTVTTAQVEIKITYDDSEGKPKERVETRNFQLRGINDMVYTTIPDDERTNSWFDFVDNYLAWACYITPNDELVKRFQGRVTATMPGGTAAGMDSNDKETEAFLSALWNYLNEVALHYVGTTGIPQEVAGDSTAMVQSCALPRDILEKGSGLCIELSLLWATMCESVGLKPYIILIPGHAFVVVQNPTTGTAYPIETTMVGGINEKEGRLYTISEGVAAAKETFDKARARGVFLALDVQREQSRGMRPPELESKDVTAFDNLLDKRMRSRRAAPPPPQPEPQVVERPVYIDRPVPVPVPIPVPVPEPQPAPTPPPPPPPAAPELDLSIQYWTSDTQRLRVAYPAFTRPRPDLVMLKRGKAPFITFTASDDAARMYVEGYELGAKPKDLDDAQEAWEDGMDDIDVDYKIHSKFDKVVGDFPARYFIATITTKDKRKRAAECCIVRTPTGYVGWLVAIDELFAPRFSAVKDQVMANSAYLP
ncbi:MAG: hypothetical protein JNM80_07170 [Phycisphaerae bacterium]|nr:hypothetical protein [Phycisphaerae bacterium]